jgi:uncharacterized membrane protein YoaK (UPF0700 family)
MFRKLLVAVLVLCAPLAEAGKPALVVNQKKAPAVVTKTSRGGGAAFSEKLAVTAGMILAFNSGFSNGCCLASGIAANKNAVAAVTGAWTTSAYGLVSGNKNLFATQLKGILSYMGGSAIAGSLIPNPKPFVVAENTGVAFLVGSALWLAASQTAKSSPTAMTCFFLALMANGLQNSVSSVHTGNLCRTAHFSGITSDIGTFAGQCLMGNKANLFKLKSFLLLGISFYLGSASAFYVAPDHGAQSLLFCSAMHFLFGSYLLLKK